MVTASTRGEGSSGAGAADGPADRAPDSDRTARASLAWILAILGLGSGLALVLSFAFPPEAMAEGAPLRLLEPLVTLPSAPCPGCPLCGMSRAFSATSHLQLARALDFNRGVVLAYPLALAAALLGPCFFLRRLLWRHR